MGHTRRNIAWGTCLLGLVLLLVPLPHPSRFGWAPLLRDACHAWVFLLMTWLLLRHWLALGQPALGAVFKITLLMAALAGGTELAQSFTGRSVDAADFARDLLGTLAGLCLAFSTSIGSRWQRLLFISTTVLALLLAARPMLQHAAQVQRRQHLFPTVEDWSQAPVTTLWSLEHNGQELPLHLSSTHPQHLHLPIHARGLTSLHGDALSMDWSRHSYWVLDCDLKAPQGLLLGLRLDAAAQPSSRLTLEARLAPGSNHIRLALPRSGKASQVLSQVGQLVIYTLDPGTDAVLALGRMTLE